MRVLVLTNIYPNPFQPQRGTFVRDSLRTLSELHPVRVISPIPWTDERRAAGSRLPTNRQVIHDGLVVDYPRYWYPPKILRGMYGRCFLWSVRKSFRSAVNEFRPDVVYTPWAYPDGWAAVRLAHQAGLPAVIKVLGSDLRLLDEHRGRKGPTALALQRADAVVTVSRDLADRAVALGADPQWTRVIYTGVDPTVFFPGDRNTARVALGLSEGVRHLLCVANLVPVKGIDVLLEACGRLPSDLKWQLHLIGEGKLKGQLSRQATAAGLGTRVLFHGSLPHSGLPQWFRAVDLFVLASRSEGVPNVLLEALACQLPFVATNVGGIPEIPNLGENCLVPPEDPQRLADAITRMLAREGGAAPANRLGRTQLDATRELSLFLEAVNRKKLVHDEQGKPNP